MVIQIKDLVSHVLVTKVDWHISLLQNWDTLVGALKTRVRLEKIQDDTLIIGVYEAHWMQELYLLSHVLLNSINTFLGTPHIKHLRFKLVEERPKRPTRKPVHHSLKTTSVITLSLEQKNALESIDDVQLKEALVQFWAHCLE